jgi:Domain of unknown function (DUF4157)
MIGSTKSLDMVEPTRKVSVPARAPDVAPAGRTCPATALSAAGNLQVQRLLRSGQIRPKLAVDPPGTVYEQEADRVASRVMAATAVQDAQPGENVAGKADRPSIQRRAPDPEPVAQSAPAVEQTLGSSGEPLDQSTRAFMEPRFGTDFSGVRVHTGERAAASAQSINALAYTAGDHVVFNAGQYAPGSSASRHLIAHELAHVVQQRGGSPSPRQGGGSLSHGNRLSTAPTGVAQRQLITPLAAGGGLGGLMSRDQAKSGELPHAPTPPPAAPGPEIRQGPIGDVIVRLPYYELFGQQPFNKAWSVPASQVTLISVPIPDLGVLVDLRGGVFGGAEFNASFGPAGLSDIQIGLSTAQAVEAGIAGALLLGPGMLLGGLLGGHLLTGEYRALGILKVHAHAGLNLHLGANLEVAASLFHIADLASLGGELTAAANVDGDLTFGGNLSLYYYNGRWHYHFDQGAEIQVNVGFNLNANAKASLLGWTWRKQWVLSSGSGQRVWTLGARLELASDDKTKTFNLIPKENDLPVFDLIKQLLQDPATASPPIPLAPQAGGGGSGSGGGGGGGVPGGGAATAPTGRTPGDAIPMTWYKPESLYPGVITLGGDDFFFKSPKWLPVPDDPGLAEVRRSAVGGQVEIGIAPNGPYFPRAGLIRQRVRVGAVRGGVKQDQFRRLLRSYGYPWDGNEADHVRDMQWQGPDEYNNLWPLPRSYNLAANAVLTQPVRYLDNTGNVVDVPLQDTPLQRWFHITLVQRP